MTKDEALNQLREVHAIQGRDGCWDIDDYMLGLYNGLELALSIVENRECRYKNRPKPEQEPVGQLLEDAFGRGQVMWFNKPKDESMLYTTPPQRTWVELTDEEILEIASPMFEDTRYPSTALDFARAILRKAQEK